MGHPRLRIWNGALAITVAIAVYATLSVATVAFASDQSHSAHQQLHIRVGGELVAHLMHATPSVYVFGVIDANAPTRFKKLLDSGKIPRGSMVYLDSPGGNLLAGIALGRLFRNAAIFTNIGVPPFISSKSPNAAASAICASACTYAYLGGLYREAPSRNEGKPFGIHQFYYASDKAGNAETTQEVSGIIVYYLHQMGVNSNVFALASMTRPNTVTWLSGDQMLALGLANNGRLPVTATYKLTMGVPYLLLEQKAFDGDHKIALLCTPGDILLQSFYIVGSARAQQIAERGTASYLEIDGTPVMRETSKGFRALNKSVLVGRHINIDMFRILVQASSIGAWVNDKNGFLRTGFVMDVGRIRGKLNNYYQNCVTTQR